MSADHSALVAARHAPGVRAALEKPFESAAFAVCVAALLDKARRAG